MTRFRLDELVEDPDRWEALILKEQRLAREDEGARSLLESIYADEDRAAAFERFFGGLEFHAIVHLLRLLDIRRDSAVCEIGAGAGHLAWALHRIGFANMTVLEPNGHYTSGVGYLKTRSDARAIRCFNGIDEWYEDAALYDTVMTHNCIHHFQNICYVAACVRTKMKPGGRWIAIREWYADSMGELYQQIRNHPYALKYGVYEFPYPSAHYVDAFRLAGFELEAVIPTGYRRNCLAQYVHTADMRSALLDKVLDQFFIRARYLLVRAYEVEWLMNRLFRARIRMFTRPQVMLFRAVDVPRER